MLSRFLAVVPFIQEHAKSITLAVGAISIWVAQVASDAMGAAKEIGGWSAASVLALVSIVLAAWVYKKECEERTDRKDREAKDAARDQSLFLILKQNSDAYNNMSDAVDNLKDELSQQKSYFESAGKRLIERGLESPQVVQARTRVQTSK